jgi:hypothetical protein
LQQSQLKPHSVHDNITRFVRNGSGSPSIVCLIPFLLSIGIVYTASIPAPRRHSASIEGNLTRRADSSDSSPGVRYSDSVTPKVWSPQSEVPEIEYQKEIREGEAMARALRLTDAEVEGAFFLSQRLPPGQPLASLFTDNNAFRSSGWDQIDKTHELVRSFNDIVPVTTALRSLKISVAARNHHYMGCEHTIPWQRGGQRMKVGPCFSSL